MLLFCASGRAANTRIITRDSAREPAARDEWKRVSHATLTNQDHVTETLGNSVSIHEFIALFDAYTHAHVVI